MARLNVPDCDVVALVLGREREWALGHILRHNDRLVRPSDEILFAWRKVNESDEGMEEAGLELERRASV